MTYTLADLAAPSRDRLAQAQAEADLSIPAWADQHLWLPRGTGPVPHNSEKTPYWRHWLARAQARITATAPDADPHAAAIEQIFLVCSAQLGKSAGLLMALLAWASAVQPREIGIVLPGYDSVNDFLRTKLRACIEATPRLDGLLPERRADRDAQFANRTVSLGTTLIRLLNGQVALELRRHSLPLLLLDEFDALPLNVDREGDPIGLCLERQKEYPYERLLFGVTTPSFIDQRGWQTLCAGTHERLLIACPYCGAHDWLNPDRLEATRTDATPDEIYQLDLAVLRCAHCPGKLTTAHLRAAITAATATLGWSAAGGWCPGVYEQDPTGGGRWIPAARVQDNGRIAHVEPITAMLATGWLNSLYSDVITCGAFLRQEIKARDATDTQRQVHVNNWRAEYHRPPVVTVDGAVRLNAAAATDGHQHTQCPHPVDHLVLAIDQQGQLWDKSWFPWVAIGWQAGGTGYLIEAGQADTLIELDALTTRAWVVAGKPRTADRIVMDTANGTLIRQIRTWLAREPARRWSISGSSGFNPETPYSVTIGDNAERRQRLCGLPRAYYINSNLMRDETYDRIRGADGCPRLHLPIDPPPFYVESLASEERITKDVVLRGGRREKRAVWQPRTWTDDHGREHTFADKNHWWDATVLNYAATVVLGLTKPRPPKNHAHRDERSADFGSAVW